MTPAQCNADILTPALALLPPGMDTPIARCHVLAIGLQESELKHRRQLPTGPARGLWMFERGGGVRGVLEHDWSSLHAERVCDARDVDPNSRDVYAALEVDDVLAAAFARLLLYTDPHKLPTTADKAWDVYMRTWRPGKPRPEHWRANWAAAKAAVG